MSELPLYLVALDAVGLVGDRENGPRKAVRDSLTRGLRLFYKGVATSIQGGVYVCGGG
jgi:hypothetical protein